MTQPTQGTTAARGSTNQATVPTAHTVDDGSAGSAAAQSVGNKVGGAFHAVHGAGEGVRGNINSFVDNVGEQIAGRGQQDVKPPSKGERPAEVAAKGADEFRAGVDSLRK